MGPKYLKERQRKRIVYKLKGDNEIQISESKSLFLPFAHSLWPSSNDINSAKFTAWNKKKYVFLTTDYIV